MHPTDALTSPTLKHLREEWWDDAFTDFIRETLRPRPGTHLLDVGCRRGVAEMAIGRLDIAQLRMTGVDIRREHVQEARRETTSHNVRARYVAGDSCRLPFRDGTFDATLCVAVLQLVCEVHTAIREFARVTRTGGRILVVEPDNAARITHSSLPSGRAAFAAAGRFFGAAMTERGSDLADGAGAGIGPLVPSLFAAHGIEALDVRLFPVSLTQLGVPDEAIWRERRDAVGRQLAASASNEVRALGRDYLEALAAYEAEARSAGPAFVEIQNTMLFATLGQRSA